MTPAEQAAFDHLRQICEVAYKAGASLFESIAALLELRSAIDQRDERETETRQALRDVVAGRLSPVEGIAQIEAVLDDVPAERISIDQLGSLDDLIDDNPFQGRRRMTTQTEPAASERIHDNQGDI